MQIKSLKSLPAYLYFCRMQILITLAYRFETWSRLVTHFIIMVVTVYLWKTVYNGVGSVSGVYENQMITYAVVSILLGSVLNSDIHYRIARRIREGEIAIDFIRPVSLIKGWFCEDIGKALGSFVIQLLPLLLLSVLFFRPSLPPDITASALFILSSIFSFIIMWSLNTIIGLMAFWILELGNFPFVKDVIVNALSGSFVPLWFFPEYLQKISVFLPFQYTFQTPLGIYINKLPANIAILNIGIQFIWCILLFSIIKIIWSRAKKAVLVQGG